MGSFCENCPNRGTATGELKGFAHEREFDMVAGVLIDSDGGMSEPLMADRAETPWVQMYVEGCNGPATERRGIFKKTEVTTCPAIGRLAVTDPSLKAYVEQKASAEVGGLLASS